MTGNNLRAFDAEAHLRQRTVLRIAYTKGVAKKEGRVMDVSRRRLVQSLALTGACRIPSLDGASQLRKWLAEARAAGDTDFAAFHVIEKALIDFGL